MYTPAIELLKAQYGFGEWATRSTLGKSLFVWRFQPAADQLSDWRLHRSNILFPPAGKPSRESVNAVFGAALEWMRAAHSVWMSPDSGDTLLIVDTYECRSVPDARELLLLILAESKSAVPVVDERLDVGDIGFGAAQRRVCLFARANLVCAIRNGGRTMVPAFPAAATLDRLFIDQPEMPPTETDRAVSLLAALPDEARVGEAVPIISPETTASEPSTWYKVFASSGEIRSDEDRVIYQPTATGDQEIAVFTVAADQHTSASRRRLGVI
jgi:hypothetical protein